MPVRPPPWRRPAAERRRAVLDRKRRETHRPADAGHPAPHSAHVRSAVEPSRQESPPRAGRRAERRHSFVRRHLLRATEQVRASAPPGRARRPGGLNRPMSWRPCRRPGSCSRRATVHRASAQTPPPPPPPPRAPPSSAGSTAVEEAHMQRARLCPRALRRAATVRHCGRARPHARPSATRRTGRRRRRDGGRRWPKKMARDAAWPRAGGPKRPLGRSRSGESRRHPARPATAPSLSRHPSCRSAASRAASPAWW